jgi:dipeptidyl aminopeptidase/acylaminoacyl peptidase
MISELERRLSSALHEDAQRARLVNPDRPATKRERQSSAARDRARSGRWLAAVAALIVAGVAAVALLQDGGDGGPEVLTTSPGPTLRNGSIVAGNRTGWPEGTAPPPRPAAAGNAANGWWEAFEQDTGSFLFASTTGSGRAWVVGEDGEQKADFLCDPSAHCASITTFGPGPDEVTAPGTAVQLGQAAWWGSSSRQDPDGPLSVQVMALDGTVRDTLDISAVVGAEAGGQPGQVLAGLAWSPDGSRLAVGTEPGFGCDPSRGPCDVQVWIFDRDGGDPELVHTQPTSDHLVEGRYWDTPVLVALAWSPDGRSLGLVVATYFLGDASADRREWPRLVALRFPPGRPVRTDALYTFDDALPEPAHDIADDFDLDFAFAWSPDGTRIAVTSQRGIAEISAEDGHVLTRHPGEDVFGPLAWLRAR